MRVHPACWAFIACEIVRPMCALGKLSLSLWLVRSPLSLFSLLFFNSPPSPLGGRRLPPGAAARVKWNRPNHAHWLTELSEWLYINWVVSTKTSVVGAVERNQRRPIVVVSISPGVCLAAAAADVVGAAAASSHVLQPLSRALRNYMHLICRSRTQRDNVPVAEMKRAPVSAE